MMRRALCLLLLAIVTIPAVAAPVQIGSKNFTESVVLGEIARLRARQSGVEADHRRALGGTRILWTALRQGDIDAYPEYTGTLTQELLPGMAADAGVDALRARLAEIGIGMTASLGFDNTYALGMQAQTAQRLGIRNLSDLAAHADLRLGLSNEFMSRADGWPGLRQSYGLPQLQVQGLDHDLAYRALASGAIEVVDLYSTDAEIPYYHLAVLGDDRHYFPRYAAVFLYRSELAQRAPAFVAALNALTGRIDATAMQGMNAAVKLEGRSEEQTAAAFLGVSGADRQGLWHRLAATTADHLRLVMLSLSLAVLLALPLGVLAARRRALGQFIIGLTSILQTVPSLAMFVFMIPLFGIGAAPAIAALFLYSLLPIVRNTHAGLTAIAPDLRESAAALGLPRGVRLWRIELPLALRPILAGIKIAAVINVGTATLGALIGAGGYGQPILTGIRLDDIGLILEGAVPAAIMALAVQGGFECIEHWLTPRGLRLQART